jgi:hypothetical protein
VATCVNQYVSQSRGIGVRHHQASALAGLPVTDGSRSGVAGAIIVFVRLAPDLDYGRLPADLSARERADPGAVGEWLTSAWSASYRSQVPRSLLLEFDDVATFLFDQATSYQRGYPSPKGRAERPLDKGHMVAHLAGGEFGPNIFPQDRALAFFFCCLLYADDSDFPAAVELGLLRPSGLHVERFRNRFDQQYGFGPSTAHDGGDAPRQGLRPPVTAAYPEPPFSMADCFSAITIRTMQIRLTARLCQFIRGRLRRSRTGFSATCAPRLLAGTLRPDAIQVDCGGDCLPGSSMRSPDSVRRSASCRVSPPGELLHRRRQRVQVVDEE